MSKKTLEQKAVEAGLPYDLVKQRIKRGMPEKKALTMPYQAQKAHKKVKDELPKIMKPLTEDEMKKVDAYADGFTLTIAIAILGVVVFGLFWMLTK